MTFLELAHALDSATTELATTKLAVEAEVLAHKALVEAHTAEQELKLKVVDEAKAVAKQAEAKLHRLLSEMKTMMGMTTEPKAQPSTSELKQIFLDGQMMMRNKS